ncbi:cation/H(+) antiporter 28 [Phalaenopsis equestris]|uniref:cation/H(+) antiporter 28 n=1 Tax=Phalaenopsis equestris TaxID=78828 RepID=UPI0009E405E8|nr:cation/H(+) antiporter 28 [Phalaenopsis equestris]
MSQNESTATGATNSEAWNIARTRCRLSSSSISASFSVFIFNIIMILISSKIVPSFLRLLGQHRMISDFIIGVLLGNVRLLRVTVEDHVIIAIVRMGSFAFCFYLLALGLEMEPKKLLNWSNPATKLACSGIVSTIGITLFCYTIMNLSGLQVARIKSYQTVCALAIALAATSSPILTRLITELKIGKSEIGRLAVRTGLANDMICTFFMCIGVLLYGYQLRNPNAPLSAHFTNAILKLLFVTIEICFIFKIINPFIGFLNDRNPEGKPIRGIDMLLVSLVSIMLCFSSVLYGYDPNFNAFIVGLCLPRHGRMSNFLISRINFALTTLILPLYVVLVGFSTDYRTWVTQESRTAYRLLIIGSIGVVGKLTGTVACSMRYGLLWPEAIALGLLLNVKGYFHIFCAYTASTINMIEPEMMMVMLLVTIGTIIPTPLVVAFIVRRARARARELGVRPLGLQWCNAGSEVRILIGLHGLQDVGMAVNVMEAMRGKGKEEEEEEGRLMVYVMDMVEMTDKAAASLVHGEGMEAVTVRDEEIVEMREQIGSALDAYKEQSGEGVRVRRMLAVSSYDFMHQDICSAAQDCMAAMVVLPFHRRQRIDGSMDAGHLGHRLMNQKVLQHSPCSVAILINRGLGRSSTQRSSSFACQNVCVVFIGGGDDREALAYAGRVARHPGVRLTVLRFLPDGKVTGPGRRILTAAEKHEMERKADEEYLAGFYERYVEGGRGVRYVEKRVGSGVETVATLRGLEGEHELFVVGRGKEMESVLTAGMSEWAEYPELGPIGDVLAAPDFSVTASVLVIQHCDVARRCDVIDYEFLPV